MTHHNRSPYQQLATAIVPAEPVIEDTMRAISLWEPFATFVAYGLKTVETRSWATGRYGWMAVHAARRNPDRTGPEGAWHCWKDGDQWVVDVDGVGRYPLNMGRIVASCQLVDCRHASQLTESASTIGWQRSKDALGYDTGETLVAVDQATIYGHLRGDRWAWLLDDVARTVDRCPLCLGNGRIDAVTPCTVCHGVGKCSPVPATGRQGWWTWKP